MARSQEGRLERFAELHREVCCELEKRHGEQMVCTPEGVEDVRQVEKTIAECARSLGDPSLDRGARAQLEAELAAAITRRQEFDRAIAAGAVTTPPPLHVTLQDVEERARRLDEVLAEGDPSRINLELSHHIDRILCWPDGRVIVRRSRLGGLADLRELLAQKPDDQEVSAPTADESPGRVKARRRARRRVDGEDWQQEAQRAAALWALAPERFADVGEQWFRQHEFRIPPTMGWAQRYAREVAEYRLTHRVSFDQLARHFGRRRGTIRKAIRIAKAQGLDASEGVWKHPRKPNWALKHATDVARFLAQPGATVVAAARHFGKCAKTIRKARSLANPT